MRTRKFKLIPIYNEGISYSISVIFIFLTIVSHEFRDVLYTFSNENFLSKDKGAGFFLGMNILFISGILISIKHIFSKGEKNHMTVTLMKYYCMVVQMFAGIACGYHQFTTEVGWKIIFPIANIILAIFPVWLNDIKIFKVHFEDQKFNHIDLSMTQAVYATSILCLTILICNNNFNLHWSLTFSIALSVAFIYNSIIIIIRKPVIIDDESDLEDL